MEVNACDWLAVRDAPGYHQQPHPVPGAKHQGENRQVPTYEISLHAGDRHYRQAQEEDHTASESA